MKYIRTKDGKIFDVSNFEIKREIYENGELKLYEFWTTRFTDRQIVQLFTSEIIKQADTIEELCDEFVLPEHKIIITWFDLKHRYTKKDLEGEIIYGAIWTDKGLQFVARMNNKGELELL